MNEEKKRLATRKKLADRPGGRSNRKDDWLGKQLRELYDEYGNSPLPDDLKALVNRLGDNEGSSGKQK